MPELAKVTETSDKCCSCQLASTLRIGVYWPSRKKRSSVDTKDCSRDEYRYFMSLTSDRNPNSTEGDLRQAPCQACKTCKIVYDNPPCISLDHEEVCQLRYPEAIDAKTRERRKPFKFDSIQRLECTGGSSMHSSSTTCLSSDPVFLQQMRTVFLDNDDAGPGTRNWEERSK